MIPVVKKSHSHSTRKTTKFVDQVDQESDIQLGYGEITYDSLKKLCIEMMKITQSSHEDIWGDIGSGFGATLPEISFLTGQRTVGIECQQYRSS